MFTACLLVPAFPALASVSTLPEVVVKAKKPVSVASKTDAPVRLTPAAVYDVDRAELDAREPKSLVEALRTVPGVNAKSGRLSTLDSTSRGFSLRQAGGEFRNGLRHFENNDLAPDLANVERLEILKGPSSVLYGLSGLGGALNVVTKVPEASSAHAIGQTVGTWDFSRTEIDSTGPFDADGEWSYRLNGAFEDGNGFQDFVNQQFVLVSPALAWRPNEDTTLVLDFEVLYADLAGNVHELPADGTVLDRPGGLLPWNFSLLDPNFNRITREQYFAGYRLDHDFSQSLHFHQGFLFGAMEQPNFLETNMTSFVGGLSGPRRFVNRNAMIFDFDWESYALDTNLFAKFETGPARHELLAGVDLYFSELENFNRQAPFPVLDLDNPVYGVEPTGPFTRTTETEQHQRWAALYAQETFIPWEPLRLVVAGRVSFLEAETRNIANPGLSAEAEDTAWTPRAGLVYTPVSWMSLYGSYSESFAPRAGTTFEGGGFVPEEGNSYEVGAKTDFWENRLSSTAAFFIMRRENVTTADSAHPGFNIQTGEQSSEGVEWEISGTPAAGWDVTAAFAFIDAQIEADNTFLAGQPLAGVPETSASFWGTYTVQAGPLKDFGAGLGLFYEGTRPGALVTAATAGQAFDVPGYVRADLKFFIRKSGYTFSVLVNNVTDEEYFSGAVSRTGIFRGEPLNIQASLKFNF